MVGTNHQCRPFWGYERQSMADIILDQVDESEIYKLYGTKWRKSALIEGAYEAEVFFPNIGNTGKWCFFTAAPIKSMEGKIIGAIETLWDKTLEKKAEEEKERHTRDLATLCSIYSALNAPLELEGRINAALEEIDNILSADGVCVFLQDSEGLFYLKYHHGRFEDICKEGKIADKNSIIYRIAKSGHFTFFNDLPEYGQEEKRLLSTHNLKSLAYIPISSKEKNVFGVIRVVSQNKNHFSSEQRHILELFGNRIGVAIENAQLQEELRRKSNFQIKLIRSANDGIVATDSHGKVVIYNQGAMNIFGYARFEVINKMHLTGLLAPDVFETINISLQAKESGTDGAWKEITITAKNGEQIPTRFFVSNLYENGKMMGSVAFFQDLREIKRLERELVQAERLAAIGQTVTGLAHYIKNILYGLKGGSYLVDTGLDRDDTNRLKTGWQMIQRNIGRVSGLVLDLLTYSKEREPEFSRCLPNDIANDVCDLLESKAKENQIDIIREFDPSIGEVHMDIRTIHDSLLNLVSNSIDACLDDTDMGKNWEIHVRTALEKDKTICFEVSDNGSGMSQEVKSKLFSSFFSTKGGKGTGLGLLVTRKLVEEHKGTIEVESEEGRGTTFIIRMPCKEPDGRAEN
jgi:PAS domain S-box-containing protein